MPNPFNQSDFEDDSRERLAERVTLKKGLRLESGCDKVYKSKALESQPNMKTNNIEIPVPPSLGLTPEAVAENLLLGFAPFLAMTAGQGFWCIKL